MKKILLGLGAVVALVAGVAAISAYEAHVINVTAHIENALYVHPNEIAFGTVFPQEYMERQFTVGLSSSFLGASRVDDVRYVIKQKPKCCDIKTCKEYTPVDYATERCPEGFKPMENLCQFLSKNDADPADKNDTSHASYYTDPTPASPNSGDEYCQQPTRIDRQLAFGPYGWAGWSCPAGTHVVGGGVGAGATVLISQSAEPGVGTYPVYPHYTYTPPETGWVVQNDNDNETISYYVLCLANNPDATGMLTKIGEDTVDLWNVDLKVPPVKGFVGQDWPGSCAEYVVPTNDVDYGCDLWVEVTGISTRGD